MTCDKISIIALLFFHKTSLTVLLAKPIYAQKFSTSRRVNCAYALQVATLGVKKERD